MPTIIGTANNDTLAGSGGDLVQGLAGEDTLFGGTLIGDTLEGGAGNDLYLPGASDIITESPGAGVDTILTYLAAFTLPANTETLKLGSDTGAAGTGNELQNIISGNNGADTLDGAANADIMAGGPGGDLYLVDHAGDQVMELNNSGTDTVLSSVDYNMMQAWHVENLTLTGSAVAGLGNWMDNVITGNAGANRLEGNRGNDTIIGSTSDTVDGGMGADLLVLEAGPTAGLANVRNVETIDITGNGDNALTVAYGDVLGTMTIEGNAGDTVLLAPGWIDGGVSGSYHQYSQGIAALLVDTDISVTM
jgi:Ca2+-binding RTX toxin-like protein